MNATHPEHLALSPRTGLTRRLLLLWAWVKAHQELHDTLTRVGWSFVQQFLVVVGPAATLLIAGLAAGSWGSAGHVGIGHVVLVALLAAVGAALVSLVLSLVTILTDLRPSNPYTDLVVRTARTFLASLGGSFGTDVLDVAHFAWGPALATATGVALGSVLKTIWVNGGTIAPRAFPVGELVAPANVSSGRGVADDGVPRV